MGDGVVLERTEVKSLARLLMARLANEWAEHVDWEDVPELAEMSWLAVAGEMDEVAREVLLASKRYDGSFNVDALYLHERATTAGATPGGATDGQ